MSGRYQVQATAHLFMDLSKTSFIIFPNKEMKVEIIFGELRGHWNFNETNFKVETKTNKKTDKY